MFYGAGIRVMVHEFLAANDTARQTAKWFQCQHVRLVGILVAEACTWIERKSPSSSQFPTFTTYHGVVMFEVAIWCWFKFTYRTFLTMYILWMLWSQYYRHVRVLHKQIQQLGLVGAGKCTEFCIVVGDPTALVVSNAVL